MGGGGDSQCPVLPSPSLAEVTLALVGKVGTGKSATANCILGAQAFESQMSYISVTKTCQMKSTTFQDRCGASRTVNVVDTPGLFDTEISVEDARKEIVKCIEMTKDGIHCMIIVLSAISRFTQEEHSALELIKLFFGDKILDHIILVFTHGDDVKDEIDWKKMLTEKSPVYLQEMLKLCQNRVVLFDNKNNDIVLREMQRGKLLDAVDLVISSNGGSAFSYQMLPHIQEAIDRQTEDSVNEYIAGKIDELMEQITHTVDEKLNNGEEEIRRLSESLEKCQKEMKDAENLRKLEDEKRNAHEEEIKNLREKLEKANRVEMSRMKEEIKSLTESLNLAQVEEQCYKCMRKKYDCLIM